MVTGDCSTLSDDTELNDKIVLSEDNVADKEEDEGTDVDNKCDDCS